MHFADVLGIAIRNAGMRRVAKMMVIPKPDSELKRPRKGGRVSLASSSPKRGS